MSRSKKPVLLEWRGTATEQVYRTLTTTRRVLKVDRGWSYTVYSRVDGDRIIKMGRGRSIHDVKAKAMKVGVTLP